MMMMLMMLNAHLDVEPIQISHPNSNNIFIRIILMVNQQTVLPPTRLLLCILMPLLLWYLDNFNNSVRITLTSEILLLNPLQSI